MTIKVDTFWARNDSELEEKLNDLDATRIIKVEYQHDDRYQVIYEEK